MPSLIQQAFKRALRPLSKSVICVCKKVDVLEYEAEMLPSPRTPPSQVPGPRELNLNMPVSDCKSRPADVSPPDDWWNGNDDEQYDLDIDIVRTIPQPQSLTPQLRDERPRVSFEVPYLGLSYHDLMIMLGRWVVSPSGQIGLAIDLTIPLPHEVQIDPNHAYIPPRQHPFM